MSGPISRRRILAAALAAGTATVAGAWSAAARAQAAGAAAPASPKVDEKDAMAVALGYVADARHVDAKANPTFQAGATCSGCSWYQGKPGDSAGGPCTFFPGKRVAAQGWCKMWNRKH
ncbi:MAG TPA: high-potential iron-sulfur protein [Steroidobacteraceae bacterium]